MDNTVEEIKDLLLGKNCSTCMYSYKEMRKPTICLIKNNQHVDRSDLCEDWRRAVHDKELLGRNG